MVSVDFSKQVIQLTGHGNYLAVAYNHCICVLGYDTVWECVFYGCNVWLKNSSFYPSLVFLLSFSHRFSAIHTETY